MALANNVRYLRRYRPLEAVVLAAWQLPSDEIGVLVERLIEIIDLREPDPDLEDSFDQEDIDERESNDSF